MWEFRMGARWATFREDRLNVYQDLAVGTSQYTSRRCTESRTRVRCARQRSTSEFRDGSGMDTGTKLIMASLLWITSVGTLAGASKTLQQEDSSHLQLNSIKGG